MGVLRKSGLRPFVFVPAGPRGRPCFAADHPADGPQVKHVCAVAPDVLMLTIQSGFYAPSEYVPYVAEPGDGVIEDGKDDQKSPAYQCPIVQDNKLVHSFRLDLKHKGNVVGMLSPDRKFLMKPGRTDGALLDVDAAGNPASYQVQSATDKAYARPAAPPPPSTASANRMPPAAAAKCRRFHSSTMSH